MGIREAADLFPDKKRSELEHLLEITVGHPLGMKLISHPEDQMNYGIEEFIENEILSDLSPKEMQVVEAASILPLPHIVMPLS